MGREWIAPSREVQHSRPCLFDCPSLYFVESGFFVPRYGNPTLLSSEGNPADIWHTGGEVATVSFNTNPRIPQ